MTLTQRLTEYIAAAFTGIWIQSAEHHDALREIAQLARQNKWALATWDIDRGLNAGNGAGTTAAAATANDPLAAIRALGALAKPDSSALLVLPNFHRLLQSAELVQALAHQIQAGKNKRTFIVILSPIVQIPIELEKSFVIIEHELPDRQQLQAIAGGIATETDEMPQGDDLQRLLDAASGLTRFEAEGAYSLSLVRHGKLQPEAIWELKTGMLKKSGLLSLHRGEEKFTDLGGLDSLKTFCTRAINASRRKTTARARGILLLSPPGCGKSQFCKSLGNETGRPTLILDIGSLMGSLVGQSEERVRQALRIIDATSPAVVFLDELEKAFAGVSSSGQTDSGVSARMFGSFLTWLADHTSDVFVVATANDISKLPPEFGRAERFDAIFYIDLPSAAEREAIWPIYLRKYGLAMSASDKRPDDNGWTGAEIQSCCRLAALLDIPLKEASRNVVPVSVSAAESVERLRGWASGRCLNASRPGIYSRDNAEQPASIRRVTRSTAN
jgi:hypothetical protein